MLRKAFVVCLMALAGHAHAILINSSAGAYDVTTITTTGLDPILADQVWWEKDALAVEFAELVNDDLGILNGAMEIKILGPYFAVAIRSVVIISTAAWNAETQSVSGGGPFQRLSEVYAVARPVPTGVPEPGTLDLLGAALLALCWIRVRRPRT